MQKIFFFIFILSFYINLTKAQTKCLKIDLDAGNNVPSKCFCLKGENNLDILQCIDPTMTQMPSDFSTSTNIEFSTVTFVGSSVKSLAQNQFKNLRLVENAQIFLSGIETFESDVFKEGITSRNPYSVFISDSLFYSLTTNKPFANATFSVLEFKNFTFPDFIPESSFADSKIDTLRFKSPNEESVSPFFVRDPFAEDISIRKFEIQNAGNIFKNNNPGLRFGIDGGLLNNLVFADLEELSIVNTNLDYIQSFIFNQESYFTKLQTIRLENVGLKELITTELFQISETASWLSGRLKRIYIGLDSEFQLSSDYICYFADLNSTTTILMYDSTGTSDAISCSCTIYWIYQNYEFSIQATSSDFKYIPKCLVNKENVQQGLQTCRLSKDSLQYCRASSVTTTTTTASTIVATNSNINGLTEAESRAMLNLMIALIVCTSVLIVGVAVGLSLILFFIWKVLKKSSTSVAPLSSSKNTV